MKATIPARKRKTQEAQTAVTAAAATPAEDILAVATPEAVVATLEAVTLEAAIREAATPEAATPGAAEYPVGDKGMAGGTQRMTKGYRS
jgi:hypothetical protein